VEGMNAVMDECCHDRFSLPPKLGFNEQRIAYKAVLVEVCGDYVFNFFNNKKYSSLWYVK
jgi:hypothetical protein